MATSGGHERVTSGEGYPYQPEYSVARQGARDALSIERMSADMPSDPGMSGADIILCAITGGAVASPFILAAIANPEITIRILGAILGR